MISALVSLVATTEVVRFQGGDDNELVQFLARNSIRTYAKVLEPGRTHARWSVRGEPGVISLKSISEASKIAFSYSLDTSRLGTAVGISGWPLTAFPPYPRLADGEYTKKCLVGWKRWEPSKGKAPKLKEISLPKGVYLTLQDVSELLGVQITSHHFYQSIPLVISSKGGDPTEIVEACALALGAKVAKLEKGYRLDFDPASFKKRVVGISEANIRTFNKLMYNKDAVNRLRLAIGVYGKLSESQVGSANETPRSSIEVDFTTGSLRDAVQPYAMSRLKEMSQRGNDFLPYLKPDGKGWVEVRADGNITLLVELEGYPGGAKRVGF